MVEYRGEHREMHDIKSLFNRIFKRLLADAHKDAVAFSAHGGGPLTAAFSIGVQES